MTTFIGLFSPVIVPLIIAGILIFSTERNNRPKLFLAGYMILILFVFTANALYFEHNYDIYAYFHSLHIGAVLAIYPGAYTYILLLVNPHRKRETFIIHFLPSLIFTLLSAFIFFLLLTPGQRVNFLAEYRFNPDFDLKWMKTLYIIRMANIGVLFIQVFLYMFLIYRVLNRHRRRVADIFSNPERFQLNWLRIFNFALSLSALITVFLYSVNPVKLFEDDRFLAYPMLLIALILWFLGIMGNNQPMMPETIFAEKENENTGEDVIAEIAARLTAYFEKDKPYLNPDLKIWDVASGIGTNRTYISKAINNTFHQNFSAFVNSYRVREAEHLLREYPEKPLVTIADEVGFGSLSSFSRSFHDLHKKSISRFRSEISVT